jgi:hypothetical protein
VIEVAATEGQDATPHGETAQKKGFKAVTGKDLVAWLALAVSLAGVSVSLVQIHEQGQQFQQQLSLQKASIEAQQGQLSIDSGSVDVYDFGAKQWESDEPNPASLVNERLTYDTFSRPGTAVFIRMHVFNISHVTLAVKSAGLVVDQRNRMIPAHVYCKQQNPGEPIGECNLPIQLQPQSDAWLSLRVNDVATKLGCNNFVKQVGLIGAVETADNRISSIKTQTFDPFSPVCSGPVGPTG